MNPDNQIGNIQSNVSKVTTSYCGDTVTYPFHVLQLNPLDRDIVVTMTVEHVDGLQVDQELTQTVVVDDITYIVKGTIVSVHDINRLKVLQTSRTVCFANGTAMAAGDQPITITKCTSPYKVTILSRSLPDSCSFYLVAPPLARAITINDDITLPLRSSTCTILQVFGKWYVL